MKVTQWFEPTVKPVHVGVYEFEGLLCPFLYWDGKAWWGSEIHPAAWCDFGRWRGFRYEFGTDYPSVCRWRGLADKP
jgi:hypothetical protein